MDFILRDELLKPFSGLHTNPLEKALLKDEPLDILSGEVFDDDDFSCDDFDDSFDDDDLTNRLRVASLYQSLIP